MKELLKSSSKKLFIWSIIINMIYSLADYGESFALSYFGTSPAYIRKNRKINNMYFYSRYGYVNIW